MSGPEPPSSSATRSTSSAQDIRIRFLISLGIGITQRFVTQ